MPVIDSHSWVTPDDLLRMQDSGGYELVNGKLVERHSGMRASEVAARIGGLIGAFSSDRRLGSVFDPNAGYQCFPSAPDNVRKADVSFVRIGRFPRNRIPKGHATIAPDLAVEVISPGDLACEVEEKVIEYVQAGVPLVWIVYPPTCSVRIHRPKSAEHGPIAMLSGDDVITGEGLLPGFSCKVSEFFV